MADASQITTLSQVIGVSNVGQVVLTDVEQDPTTGYFVRELRVYDTKDDGTTGQQVFTVQFTSPSRAGIEVVTPQLSF